MNTVGTNIYLLITGSAVVAIMVWVLRDGLRTGKLPLRFGGIVRRREQPVAFWLTAALIVTFLALCAFGMGAAAIDLANRG